MPRAGFLWKLCPGALVSLPVWQLITMCTRFQTCNKRPLKTHIIGITAHEDLRKTSRSPCRRSISKAPNSSGITALQSRPFRNYTLDFHALIPACCGSFLQPSASAHLRGHVENGPWDACTYTCVLRFVFAAFCKCTPPGTGEERTLGCMHALIPACCGSLLLPSASAMNE